MISPVQLRAQLARRYPAVRRSWLRGEAWQPLAVRVGPKARSYAAFQHDVDALHTLVKTPQSAGARLATIPWESRKHGLLHVPHRLWVDTLEDYLALAGKERAFRRFRDDVGLIRAGLPQIEAWLQTHPGRVAAYHTLWPELIAIGQYSAQHDISGQALRELPWGPHTKFVEQHADAVRAVLDALGLQRTQKRGLVRRYGLRPDILLRVRALDNQWARHGLPFTDISAPLHEWAAMALEANQRLLIVENLTTFLSLPSLRDTFGVYGGGAAVTNMGALPGLWREREWLYWGDLDAAGFEILNALRREHSFVRSVLMDKATFDRHLPNATDVPVTPPRDLTYLSGSERALYQRLCTEGLRLEQERLPQPYVQACFTTLQ